MTIEFHSNFSTEVVLVSNVHELMDNLNLHFRTLDKFVNDIAFEVDRTCKGRFDVLMKLQDQKYYTLAGKSNGSFQTQPTYSTIEILHQIVQASDMETLQMIRRLIGSETQFYCVRDHEVLVHTFNRKWNELVKRYG